MNALGVLTTAPARDIVVRRYALASLAGAASDRAEPGPAGA